MTTTETVATVTELPTGGVTKHADELVLGDRFITATPPHRSATVLGVRTASHADEVLVTVRMQGREQLMRMAADKAVYVRFTNRNTVPPTDTTIQGDAS